MFAILIISIVILAMAGTFCLLQNTNDKVYERFMEREQKNFKKKSKKMS